MDEFKKDENKDFDTESSKEYDIEQIDNAPLVEDAPKYNLKKEILDWVVSIVVAVIIALVIRTYVFTLVKVDGLSMSPTLSHGDTLYTNRFFYTPKNGDIIIFRPPNSVNTPYVKRVIATAGQTVVVDAGNHTVTVDGKVLDEPYIKEPMMYQGNMRYPCTVPEGYVFVLGDNRNNSRDSRDASVGLIPLSNVIGKATLRLLPLADFGSLY